MVDLVKVAYGRTGTSKTTNAMGMRPMQARVYEARGAQFILLKAPPAAGKSRALMFLGLDKLENQGVRKVIVAVPETSIGASFRSTELRPAFFRDWHVEPRWNLCESGAEEGSKSQKVKAFREFMASDDEVIVCTHATFRFAYDAIEAEIGAEAFDDCLIAIDEFHHVSAGDDNRLGEILRRLLVREKAHVVAMTGSYFRGDSIPVLRPEDEAKFRSITYSYYEQLDGYEHLKSLGISYSFYRGKYISAIPDVLDTDLKTIVHIPHRGSAEAYGEKNDEVGRIIDAIGEHVGRDEETGFDLVRRKSDGKILKVADLVNDNEERGGVKSALTREITGPDGRRDDAADRDKVDIIIALGMAKEGFDWPWCEHALTIGYRSSLTEIVQIIGRATRDAAGKAHAQFTNLIAEPGVETTVVADAVNDMLKAISGALLMEQVLQPNFRFYRREDGDIREPIEVDDTGTVHIGIKGLMEPPTNRSKAICENDMQDLMAKACQAMDRRTVGDDIAPEVATQMVLTDIIEKSYENLSADETEAIRQDLAARMNIANLARREAERDQEKAEAEGGNRDAEEDEIESAPDGMNLINMVKKFINVRELDIDLIDGINPFREGFDVASKALDTPLLKQIQSAMVAQRIQMTEDEARTLWPRIKRFREAEGREPNPHAADPLEKRMAEALAYIRSKKAERLRSAAAE
ncbi:DEAD/DEAH box helicase [Pseudooceanicola sp. 216_PA32_1]|uniref:DEAD/DEAH box helicase n=1 Tax=Pseudooceanicola pacificus TaxID=2676438 RepID=A0A844WC25_9RHOB|nr:DEAD/DEAH box helicase family protein [Pseudooceanicola pacificus]MWB78498.1 DEAD/DEAH box helicase [Pseudooceanicola pacificus]